MKGSWPKISACMRFELDATHAMTRLGAINAAVHAHHYEVTFGWTHEIQPKDGFTFEYSEQHRKFRKLLSQLDGKHLNDVLPMQPSAEALALWLLSRTDPAYCDHVAVRCYDGYEVRADRKDQRSEWMLFLADRGPDPYSNDTFTLK